MKERKTGKGIRRGLARVLLFQLLAITFIGYESNAQGWTFTPQIKLIGNCEGGGAAAAQANAMLSALGNLSLPTKSMCESLRQQVLAIQVGGGDCLVGYTCTPCTGSDLGVSGQIAAAGQINNNSVLQGRSFFSSHESTAFEDWATEYKQLLASYGITSILGKDIIPNRSLNIPVTGNLPMDTTYAGLAASFNPSAPPVNPYSQDASVVDLTHLGDKPGVVKLLTDEEEQKKRDEWLKKQEYVLKQDNIISDEPAAPSYFTDELLNSYSKLGINLVKFGLVGLATPVAIEGAAGVAVTLAATAVICVGFKEFEAVSDYIFEDIPIPPQKEIIVNSLGDVAVDVLSTGLGKAVGELAANSKIVQGIVTQDKIAKGVLPGIARLSTAEMKAGGQIAGKVETAFGIGYEIGAEGQTVNEIMKKWSGR